MGNTLCTAGTGMEQGAHPWECPVSPQDTAGLCRGRAWADGDGTGPPDGQAKVREGDGHAAGRAGLGGRQWDHVSADGALQGHLPMPCWPCPGRQQRFGSREKGRPRLGNLEGLGPITGVSQPLGTVCASTQHSSAATTSQASPGEISLLSSSAPLIWDFFLNTAVTWHHLLASLL